MKSGNSYCTRIQDANAKKESVLIKNPPSNNIFVQYNVKGGFFSDDIMVLVRSFGTKTFFIQFILKLTYRTLTKNGGRIQTSKFAISDFAPNFEQYW